MRTLLTLLITSMLPILINAQSQLEIQGDPASVDTVAIIKVNSSGVEHVVGLSVHSAPSIGSGVAGYFYGGNIGIYGDSYFGLGVRGLSNMGTGVKGESSSFYGVLGMSSFNVGVYGFSNQDYGVYGLGSKAGAFFESPLGTAIELGGADSEWGQEEDDCVIRADALDAGSDLIMVANDVISFHMDDDSNSTSIMYVYNGTNMEILTLDESGNLNVTGNITANGTCCSSSDVNRKENLSPVDRKKILNEVAALPISEWQFMGETTRHLGPMAQDFYATFGLGDSETTIASVDADGVALAAIQALKAENDTLKKRLELLEVRLASLEQSSKHKGLGQ